MISPLFYLSLVIGVDYVCFFSPLEPEAEKDAAPFIGLFFIGASETIKNQIEVECDTFGDIFLVCGLSLLNNVLCSR
jgi:hypothetical protein